MRQPAIKRSAFAVVDVRTLRPVPNYHWLRSLLASVRSRTHGIHEHGTSRIRASRRIAASFTGKAATWMKTKANSGRSLASASLRRCAALLRQWNARMRERAFLATLNDVQLRDMGLSSTDRWREVNKPFWQP